MVARKASDEDILAALERNGGIRAAAARELGITARNIMFRLDGMRSRGVEVPESSYDGRPPTGTSTLYGADGEVKLKWVKRSQRDEERNRAIHAAAEAMAATLPRLPATPFQKAAREELATCYTITDAHVGMLSWPRETGAQWDLAEAERVLVGSFLEAFRAAPASGLGIINQLGDMLHADGLVPATPTSGHILDVDSRFPKVAEAAVRILRRIVDAALKKHAQVRVYMHEGNHDPASSIWLRTLFAALYEREPRVHVETSPSPYVALRHGKTMIGFHHGHLAKKDALPLLFAAKFPEIWGKTRHRYVHVGHLHYVDEKEHPGITVIQHPTLAAPDAYSSRGGWISRRQAAAITYHMEHGEVGRSIVVPEMAA